MIDGTSGVSRRTVLCGGAAAGLMPLLAGAAEGGGRRPNIVFIYADDLGYGDLGCYGAEKIKTPNLDRMAAEGMRFTSFYSCAAVCTPSRAGLMTGRYQVRSGLINVLFPASKTGMPDSEITIAQALKKLGYATACVGKWHMGHLPRFLPTRHGFDSYYGIPYSNDMKPRPMVRGEETIEAETDVNTLTQRYTAEAVKFIAAAKGGPFFLYLPHNMPHVPLGVSPNFKGKSAGGLYGDVIEELDWSVGEVLKAIKENGLDENTLVVFSSDNGPWLIMKERGGSAGKLRNGKGTTFEGGVREPCIARWPGKIKAGSVADRPAIMVDWLPTFVALAGGKPPEDRVIDGKDISPVLLGTGKRADEEFFFYVGWQLQAHRSGPWKLKLPLGRGAQAQPLMLFNLDDDPNETTNLAEKRPEVVGRLKAQMVAFQKTVPTTRPTTIPG